MPGRAAGECSDPDGDRVSSAPKPGGEEGKAPGAPPAPPPPEKKTFTVKFDGMPVEGEVVGRSLAGQFAFDSKGTGGECLLGLLLEQCGIASYGK